MKTDKFNEITGLTAQEILEALEEIASVEVEAELKTADSEWRKTTATGQRILMRRIINLLKWLEE